MRWNPPAPGADSSRAGRDEELSVLAGRDVAGTQGIAMVQMSLHSRFRDFKGLALVTDDNFLGRITGV
jgi:hypothetical protein